MVTTESYSYPNHTRGYNTSCFVTLNDAPAYEGLWQLSNGTYLGIDFSGDMLCETKRVLSLLQDWLFEIGTYAYPIGGVHVDKNAIGAPFDLRYNTFRQPFCVWETSEWRNNSALGSDQDLQYATGCFPILGKNPVKCQTQGTVSINGSQLSAEAGGCTATSPALLVDPSTFGASVNGICTNGHKLGTATAIIGSVNWHASQ